MVRTFLLTVLLLVGACPALAHEVRVPNGSFEEADPKDASPAHWYAGEPGHAGYEVKVVEGVAEDGRASLMIRSGLNGNSFGAASRDIPPEKLAGRQVTLSGYIRTKDLNGGHAGLWLRVYGPDGILQSADMQEGELQGPSGTTPWQRYTVSLTVDPAATGISYGVMMPGQGTAWFDNLRLEVDRRH